LRQLAVFFQQLGRIAARAAVNPVALIAAATTTAAATAVVVATSTPTIAVIIVVIPLVIQGNFAFSLGPAV
jgi:hypothetical protein